MFKNIQKIFSSWLFALVIAGSMPLCSQAQQHDSLAGMRQFIELCNSYKTLPLQVVMQVRNSSNIVSALTDTANIEACFYIGDKGSYVRYGELEQVGNDSLVLLVSNEAKRMLLYPNNSVVTSRLKQMTGFYLQDSSVQKLAKSFTVKKQQLQDGTAGITIQSRVMVYGTTYPREEVTVLYDVSSNLPDRILQTTRAYTAIDTATYASLQQQQGFEDKLVKEGDEYYVIKEQISTYRYVSVSHNKDTSLPVLVSDRIRRLPNGEYEPSSGYSDFSISRF